MFTAECRPLFIAKNANITARLQVSEASANPLSIDQNLNQWPLKVVCGAEEENTSN